MKTDSPYSEFTDDLDLQFAFCYTPDPERIREIIRRYIPNYEECSER